MTPNFMRQAKKEIKNSFKAEVATVVRNFKDDTSKGKIGNQIRMPAL